MKRVFESTQVQMRTCGTVCDRCGVIEDEPANDDDATPTEAFVSVRVDYGSSGEVLRGDFCPNCDRDMRNQPGGWRSHLRAVTRFLEDREYRVFRFQVQDARTNERRWIESILPDDEMM